MNGRQSASDPGGFCTPIAAMKRHSLSPSQRQASGDLPTLFEAWRRYLAALDNGDDTASLLRDYLAAWDRELNEALKEAA